MIRWLIVRLFKLYFKTQLDCAVAQSREIESSLNGDWHSFSSKGIFQGYQLGRVAGIRGTLFSLHLIDDFGSIYREDNGEFSRVMEATDFMSDVRNLKI